MLPAFPTSVTRPMSSFVGSVTARHPSSSVKPRRTLTRSPRCRTSLRKLVAVAARTATPARPAPRPVPGRTAARSARQRKALGAQVEKGAQVGGRSRPGTADSAAGRWAPGPARGPASLPRIRGEVGCRRAAQQGAGQYGVGLEPGRAAGRNGDSPLGTGQW